VDNSCAGGGSGSRSSGIQHDDLGGLDYLHLLPCPLGAPNPRFLGCIALVRRAASELAEAPGVERLGGQAQVLCFHPAGVLVPVRCNLCRNCVRFRIKRTEPVPPSVHTFNAKRRRFAHRRTERRDAFPRLVPRPFGWSACVAAAGGMCRRPRHRIYRRWFIQPSPLATHVPLILTGWGHCSTQAHERHHGEEPSAQTAATRA
jgi:hypothetical protein